MEERQMIQMTKDVEQALAGMSAVELIQLFGKLEEVRFGVEDTFGTVVGGHAFHCNKHRTENQYIIDNEPVTETKFFELRKLIDLELKGTYSISIHIRPPHKRKPEQTGPDGIILIPESLLGEGE